MLTGKLRDAECAQVFCASWHHMQLTMFSGTKAGVCVSLAIRIAAPGRDASCHAWLLAFQANIYLHDVRELRTMGRSCRLCCSSRRRRNKRRHHLQQRFRLFGCA